MIRKVYLWTLLFILYAPIFVIAIFSFTEAKVLGNWTGFSFGLYKSLFTPGAHVSLLQAFVNTLIVSFSASAIATLLGTVAAFGIHNIRNKTYKGFVNSLNGIPILNADIITGISLFLLFVTLGVSQGYLTLILAHVTFCTPYVVLCVLPRLQQLNPSLYEAALDLGATPGQAFRKVIVPQVASGMGAGFLLSLVLSIDDFEISVFNLGNIGLDTLSTYIYADSRKGGLTPELRPLLTIFFLLILVLLVVSNLRSRKAQSQLKK